MSSKFYRHPNQIVGARREGKEILVKGDIVIEIRWGNIFASMVRKAMLSSGGSCTSGPVKVKAYKRKTQVIGDA